MSVNMIVERLLKRKQITGDIPPLRQGGSQKSELNRYSSQLCELVKKYPDSRLSEYCEYCGNIYGQWISPSTMCRELKRLGLTKKKRCSWVVKRRQTGCKNQEENTGKK
jgi:transposase